MDSFYWLITVLLALAGLVGSVLPLVPGPALLFAAGVVHRLLHMDSGSPGAVVLTVLGLLMLAAYSIDFLGGIAGAKYFGASRWGAIGAIVGAIVGIFFGLPGLFVGPLVGALVGELLGGKGLLPAGQSGIGAVIGTTAGILAKVGAALLMALLLLLAILFGW